jgi:hypothetical protein
VEAQAEAQAFGSRKELTILFKVAMRVLDDPHDREWFLGPYRPRPEENCDGWVALPLAQIAIGYMKQLEEGYAADVGQWAWELDWVAQRALTPREFSRYEQKKREWATSEREYEEY